MVTQKGSSKGTLHGSFHERDSFLRLRVEYLASCLLSFIKRLEFLAPKFPGPAIGKDGTRRISKRCSPKDVPNGRLCLSSTRGHSPKLTCRTAGSDGLMGVGVSSALIRDIMRPARKLQHFSKHSDLEENKNLSEMCGQPSLNTDVITRGSS